MPKYLILGHARHGKDTVAEYMNILGIKAVNASILWSARVYEALGYKSIGACYEDRVNHRVLWGEMIALFCKDDKARLAKLVYAQSDVYCGCRRQDELDAVIAEFDPVILYVDASKRIELESLASYSITVPDRAIVLDNNGSKEKLLAQVDALFRF